MIKLKQIQIGANVFSALSFLRLKQPKPSVPNESSQNFCHTFTLQAKKGNVKKTGHNLNISALFIFLQCGTLDLALRPGSLVHDIE